MTAKIVVVGSYNRDVSMACERLPVRGESLLGKRYREGPGGKGSNQAIAAARLGGRVHFIGCIGQDSPGDNALELWQKEGLYISVRRDDRSTTGVALITVLPDGKNAIVVAPGANRALSRDDLVLMEESIAEADTLLVQLEIQVDTVVAAIALAEKHGVRVVLNPAPAQPLPAEIYPKVDVLTPNETEARTLTGERPNSTTSLEYVVAKLQAKGIKRVVLTRGEQGALLAHRGAGLQSVSAPKIKALDPTGSGDAFNAALAVAVTEGQPLAQAVRWACAAGAYCATRLGVLDGLPRRDELDDFVKAHLA